jgi:small-conductance mechanosensitive channel
MASMKWFSRVFCSLFLAAVLMLAHADPCKAQKDREDPGEPKMTVAAPAPEDLKLAIEESAGDLDQKVATLRTQVSEAARGLVRMRKATEELELETALARALLALRQPPIEKVQGFADHFNLRGVTLESAMKQSAAELEALKEGRAKDDASLQHLEKEIERLRASRLSNVWNDTMEESFQAHQREWAAHARAVERLMEIQERKLELLNRQKAALDLVTPQLSQMKEVWNAELLKRQEALPLKHQVAQLWSGMVSLPQRGVDWALQTVQSQNTRKFVFDRPGSFVGLLLILALLLWMVPRLKAMSTAWLRQRQSASGTGLGILLGFGIHLASQSLFILLALWIGLALQALNLSYTNAGHIILTTLATLLLLRLLLRLNRSIFGAGNEGPLIPVEKDIARFYRRNLRGLLVYVALGGLGIVIIQRLGFPGTVSQLIRYILEIGFIIAVHRLLQPARLEPLVSQLCPPTWSWQRWTRWARPVRMVLISFTVVDVLVYLIGFQGLAAFTATAMTRTLGLLFFWGVLSLVGRLSIHTFLHAGDGWMGRRLPERADTLARLCSTVQRLFELLVTTALALWVLAAWGIEWAKLMAALAWLKWEIPIGSVHFTPLSVILAVLVIYLGISLSKLFTQVLGGRIFPRTGWDIGVQYTISTILHYVMLILSGLLALNILGFPLANLALIMGAVGVGVGLGLQNIVSNFFSGLILLIERPIKVGDLLVIDDQWGEVKEIRIRSTLFETFDKSILIIPNSDLTSGKILNWTHYGRGVTRIKLQVGVSYDSDVRQVTQILKDICRENSRVMADPAPNISFSAYGESSLDFNIMVHVRAPEDRVPATHELNTAIFDAFREHGIEIPFPQRDLYIKNWPRQLTGDGDSADG